ncbi:MAG: RNA-binding protein [Rhizomicrobium sp.]
MTHTVSDTDERTLRGHRGSRQRHDAGGSRSRERGDAGGSRSRERRCIVSGDILPDGKLVRFVLAPDGEVIPDVSAKLPGRGYWVTASRGAVEAAVKGNCFSRAAKAHASVRPDLADRTEKALVAQMQGDLGLARRAGQLLLGFEKIVRGLTPRNPPALLLEARDGSPGGRRKLENAIKGKTLGLLDCLTGAELALALGRENVIHAAVRVGGLAQRLQNDAARLEGFRGGHGNESDS